MKTRTLFTPLALAGLLFAGAAQAQQLDLLEAYRYAVEHDPRLFAAREQLRADHERLPQARSTFLPQIRAEAGAERVRQDIDLAGVETQTFDTHNIGVGLVQPLFRKESFTLVRQANVLRDQADLSYEQARQELLLRVAQAYFRVLQADDALESFDAELRAIESQLRRAERALELGAGTITDVNDARARFDATRARQIGARNELQLARENLARIIGVRPESLAGLRADFQPEVPQPTDPGEWAERAERDNLQALLARSGVEMAGHEIERQRAARYPRVDLVARYGRSRQAPRPPSPAFDVDQASIGINVSMPLYTGGAIGSQVREARARREVAFHQQQDARREAALGAESAYLSLVAGREQIRALEQAQHSIRGTEQSTQRGVEVGLRTTLDLLNIQRERFNIERDLDAARYNYLLTYLQLQAAVGAAQEEEVIHAVNSQLAGR